MWLEVWTRPGDSSFAKRIDDLPFLDQSWTRRPNGVGEGTAVLPDTYDRFDEILTSDPDTPANDVSSLIRVYRGSTLLYEWIPLEIVPSEGTDDPRVEVKGAGIEAILGYARVEPWDWDGTDDFTSLFPDWIWGGRNLLGELGSRYIPHEVEVTLNYADAGTFTLSVTTDAGSDTTGNIAYDATANAVDVALTALSNLTFPDVEGETPSWTVRFSDETQTLSVTGDASNLDGAWQICVTGASGGTFTVTIDGNTSGTIAFDATSAVVETAIEAVTGITAASVERVSVTDGFCWNVFFDTPTSVSTFTINDTGLTGAGSEVGSVTQFTPTITIDIIQEGSIVPAGWEVSQSYLSELPHGPVTGFRMWQTGDPALPAGCSTAIRFDGGEPYFPGIQKVVRVTPGSRVQASAKILSEGSAETVRLVVRDLAEQEIGGAGQARDEQTLVADTWTDFSIADIDIPDNVSEVIFRVGHVGSGDPVPIWTACPVLSEGLQATTVGGIFDALYDDAVTDHSATRVVWDDGGGTPYLTLDFTSVLDSAGAAWSDSEVSMTVKRGQSYLRVLQEFARLGYEWQLIPNSISAGTWKLQLFNTGNLGTVHTGSDSPTIQGSRDVVRREVRRFLPEFTDYSVEGDEQKSSRARNTAAVTALGRIEGYLPNVDLSSSEAASVAAQAVTQTLARSKSLVYTVTPGDLHPVPGVDYVVGDILNVLDPPEVPKQERRVMAITGLDGAEGERFRVSLGSESFIGVGAIYEGVRQLLAEFDAIRRDAPGEGVERLGTSGGGAEGGSVGAYIHLSRSASQEIPVNGAAVEWDTVSTLIPPVNFTVVPPSTDITVTVGGYYDLGIMLGWSSFTDGGSVWVTRTRDGSETTVWPPSDDPGIWTATDGQLFEATAKGIPCQPGDVLRVYVDADDASPQTLSSATVTVELVDRTDTLASSYRQLILSHGPLAYWRLGETSGSTADDIAGHASGPFDGTYTGTVTRGIAALIKNAESDTCCDFHPANNGYVLTAENNTLKFLGTQAFTVEAWVNADTAQESGSDPIRTIVACFFSRTGSDEDGWRLEWTTDGGSGIVFIAERQNATSLQQVQSGGLSLDTTYHVAMTFDGTTLRLYVNGALVDSNGTTVSIPNGDQGGVTIGTVETSSANPYTDFGQADGRIDEVALWNRALTADELAAHYQKGSVP